MALDRQSIEKRDFPVGRRGYDPDAVDAHLSALASEVEEFKRSARQRSDTLASTTSDRVRAIIEAAESSAAEIQRAAEEEARQVRDAAGNEVRSAREQASGQAREHVERVAEATNAMLARLGSMEQELGSLIESLRTGASRLVGELQQLEGELGLMGSAGPASGGGTAPRGAKPPAPAADEEYLGFSTAGDHEPALAAVEPAAPAYDDGDPGAPEPAPEAAELQEVVGGPEAASARDAGMSAEDDSSDDAEGARLIALNMALNGTPREETARYLSENFKLADAGGLLDEVYASVEG
ncbi:MAG TPA: hypothetical protein VFN87_17095 [Solirubrobacteraceae bacterium]|nr:hypothetical protein [Solirubrobacteraceae bacterium]